MNKNGRLRSIPSRTTSLLAGLAAAGLLLTACGTPALPSQGEPSSVPVSAATTTGTETSQLPASLPAGNDAASDGGTQLQATSAPAYSASPEPPASPAGQDMSGQEKPAESSNLAAAAVSSAAPSQRQGEPAASEAKSQVPAAGNSASAVPSVSIKPAGTPSASAAEPAAQTGGKPPLPTASPAVQKDQLELPVNTAIPTPSAAATSSPPPYIRTNPNGPEPLRFSELYGEVGVRGMKFSDKLKALDGQKVEMTGYMAPPLSATVRFFVLTRIALTICPFCSSDADWPSDIIVIYLPDGSEMKPTEHQVKIIGTLSVGSQTDDETGFVSQIRINADKTEVLK